MIDLSDDLLPQLSQTRLPQLKLPPRTILPAYHGLSILNLSASLLAWLGAEKAKHPALKLPELDRLAEGADRVVVCLIDAVSHHRFREWIRGQELDAHFERALLAPLTSVTPSSTTAALTSIWTATSPAEHGILGFELFLREYGLIANMIAHTPAGFSGRSGSLAAAGFQPQAFLTVPTLSARLVDADVEVVAFLPKTLVGSGLSEMHLGEASRHGYGSLDSLWRQVRELLERDPARRRFIWVYHDRFDALSHHEGPDSPVVQTAFQGFAGALRTAFFASLSPAARKKTLFLLLADHGQIGTRPDPHYDLKGHPSFRRRLHMDPTGELRLSYLYVRPGQTEAVAEYVQRTWPGGFRLLHAAAALDDGLFGPGQPAPQTLDRIGDRILLPAGDGYLWWAAKENPLYGMHGGLSPEEMLVPLLALRLDDA